VRCAATSGTAESSPYGAPSAKVRTGIGRNNLSPVRNLDFRGVYLRRSPRGFLPGKFTSEYAKLARRTVKPAPIPGTQGIGEPEHTPSDQLLKPVLGLYLVNPKRPIIRNKNVHNCAPARTRVVESVGALPRILARNAFTHRRTGAGIGLAGLTRRGACGLEWISVRFSSGLVTQTWNPRCDI
jgi:hypothetical protein